MSVQDEVAAAQSALGLSEVKWVVAVGSGKGGVGKSSVALNLSLALSQQGIKVGLLDGDIYGPSQALLLGLPDGTRPSTHGQRFAPVMAHGLATMSMAYLATEQTPLVWRGPMASGALQQMLLQTDWGSLDVLIVDLPPGTGDIQLTLSQKIKLAGVVVVTTPQPLAVLDARKALAMFQKVDVPLLGLIENMSHFDCPSCQYRDSLFGEGGALQLQAEFKVPLLAQLGLVSAFGQACNAGTPFILKTPEHPVSTGFRTAASKLLEGLNQHNAPNVEIEEIME
mgnify:CR=1 FL=1